MVKSHKMNSHISARNKLLFSLILIIALTFLSFSSSLNNGFVNWDDDKFVTANYLIQDLSWENIRAIFTSFYKQTFRQPLVLLSFSLEYNFFQLDPFIYHLNNLILHILNTILVFFLFSVFLNRSSVYNHSPFTIHHSQAFITALLFGIHPLHVESVAWISERKDVLSTFFFLQTIIYYLFYKEKGKLFWYYLALLVFILSLLSKAMVVTLPVVLLLCDYLFKRRFNKKTLLEKLPFFIISCIFGIINIFIHQSAAGVSSERVFSIFDNFFISCKNIIFYIFKTILPLNLSALYPYPSVVTILSTEYFIPPFLLLILSIAVFYSRRWTRGIIFGSLFFIITLLPIIQIIPVGRAAVADRYMYIPSIGLFFIIGLGFQRVYNERGSFERIKRFASVVILCVAIINLSILTFKRNGVWQDSETLWLNVIKNNPESSVAHVNLGDVYVKDKRLDRAVKEYEMAVKLEPDSAVPYNGLGVVYLYQGRLNEAVQAFKAVLRLKPDMGETHYNLASAYLKLNRLDEAITSFERALEYVNMPTYISSIHNNLGNVYLRKGLLEKAIKEYKEALRLTPDHKNALRNLEIAQRRYLEGIGNPIPIP